MRLRSGKALPSDWLRQQVQVLHAAAVRMAAALEAITDVAQLHSGHALNLETEPVALGAVVREVASGLADGYSRGATPIDVVVPPTDVVVRADRVRLERVLQNVICNAINYSPAGVPVHVAVGREGGWAVITIRDHGIGIPSEELPHIFTRFYRASTSRGIKGTGLGLAGSKAIVEQHGGQISVVSALGQGTTVTVRLPIVGG